MDLRIDEKHIMQSFKKCSNIWHENGQLQKNEQNHITFINQCKEISNTYKNTNSGFLQP